MVKVSVAAVLLVFALTSRCSMAAKSCGTGASWSICYPSPNFNNRTLPVTIIVLHYTYLNDKDSLSALTSTSSGVSAHYLVMQNGTTYQLVDEADRSWHAGVSSWKGETNVNSASIGIEIVNYDDAITGKPLPYTDNQMTSIVRLCKDITTRYGILPENVIGHSDVAPSRKSDPGAHFSWETLYQQGVGHWITAEPIDSSDKGLGVGSKGETVLNFQKQLARYGYGYVNATGTYDQTTKDVVLAFQRHFRQSRCDGLADNSTINTLNKLIEALEPQVVTPWPRPSALIGYWPLSAEYNAKDASLNKYNGELHVNSVSSFGPFGDGDTARKVEQSLNSAVLTVDNGDVAVPGYFTVSLFFKVANNSSKEGGLFEFGSGTMPFQFGYVNGTTLEVVAYQKTIGQFTIIQQKGAWTYAALVYDGRNLTVYGKHGRFAWTSNVASIADSIPHNKNGVKLGYAEKWGQAGIGDAFSCLAVYRAPLTEREIRQLYESCRVVHGSVPCGSPRLPLSPLPSETHSKAAVPAAGQFPWMASLRYNSSHICSATILDEFWLVTYEGCLATGDLELYSVVVGEHDLNVAESHSRIHAVATIIKENKQGHALIQLEEPIDFTNEFVNNICLYGDEATSDVDFDGAAQFLAVWESTSKSLASKTLPRYVSGKIATVQSCPGSLSDNDYGCFLSSATDDPNVPCYDSLGAAVLVKGNANLITGMSERLVALGEFYLRTRYSTQYNATHVEEGCEGGSAFIKIAPDLPWIKGWLRCSVPGIDTSYCKN